MSLLLIMSKGAHKLGIYIKLKYVKSDLIELSIKFASKNFIRKIKKNLYYYLITNHYILSLEFCNLDFNRFTTNKFIKFERTYKILNTFMNF